MTRTHLRSPMALLLAFWTASAGCADMGSSGDDGAPPADRGVADARAPDQLYYWDQVPISSDAAAYTGEPVVYAHSSDKLYKVDPDTLAVTLVGKFGWPGLSDQMTDIALDRKGQMIGISYTSVYSVDPKTAKCTLLAGLKLPAGANNGFNGLSYITSLTGDGKEALWATSLDGRVYELSPGAGTSTQVGSFGGPGSSGDLVSVKSYGILATVKKSGVLSGTDWLASIDAVTGKALLIGDTGYKDIWGLGFWKNKVFGFTSDYRFLLIDPKTGQATQVSQGSLPWWGAGVTTEALVIK